MNHSQQIANTILRQLGGVGKLSVMIGASNFVSLESGVQFSFKHRITNKCVIKLESNDTYTVELWKINVRKGQAEKVSENGFVYADMLKRLFEMKTGLNLSL